MWHDATPSLFFPRTPAGTGAWGRTGGERPFSFKFPSDSPENRITRHPPVEPTSPLGVTPGVVVSGSGSGAGAVELLLAAGVRAAGSGAVTSPEQAETAIAMAAARRKRLVVMAGSLYVGLRGQGMMTAKIMRNAGSTKRRQHINALFATSQPHDSRHSAGELPGKCAQYAITLPGQEAVQKRN